MMLERLQKDLDHLHQLVEQLSDAVATFSRLVLKAAGPKKRK